MSCSYHEANGTLPGLVVPGQLVASIKAIEPSVLLLLPQLAVEMHTAHGRNQEVTHHVHLFLLRQQRASDDLVDEDLGLQQRKANVVDGGTQHDALVGVGAL